MTTHDPASSPLRAEIARRHGLTQEEADQLRGTTPQELEADAATLARRESAEVRHGRTLLSILESSGVGRSNLLIHLTDPPNGDTK
jgi:hypothetical protein